MIMYKRVNYYELCRLCSTSEGQKTSALPFTQTIESCLSITITDKDVLPSVICTSCEEKLMALNEFRQSSISSQGLLKSFLETNSNSRDFIQNGMVYVKSNVPGTIIQEQGPMQVNGVSLPAVEHIQPVPVQQFEQNSGGQNQLLFTYQQPFQGQNVQEYITQNVYNQQPIQPCNQNQPILLSSNNNLCIDINHPPDGEPNIITVLTMLPNNVQAVGLDTQTLTRQYQNVGNFGNERAITPANIENVPNVNMVAEPPQFEQQYQMPIQSNVALANNDDNVICYNMGIPMTPANFQQNLNFDQSMQNRLGNIQQVTMNSNIQQIPMNSSMQQIPMNSSLQQIPMNSNIQQIPMNSNIQQIPMNNNMQQIPMQIAVPLPVINISPIRNEINEPLFLGMPETRQLSQNLPVNNVDVLNDLNAVERS